MLYGRFCKFIGLKLIYMGVLEEVLIYQLVEIFYRGAGRDV